MDKKHHCKNRSFICFEICKKQPPKKCEPSYPKPINFCKHFEFDFDYCNHWGKNDKYDRFEKFDDYDYDYDNYYDFDGFGGKKGFNY